MADEQAFIVHLRLRGDEDERARILSLEDELEKAIHKARVGKFDGDEWGEGNCVLYMYGPDAERLYSVTAPALRTFKANPGSWGVVRFGTPGAGQKTVEV